MHFVYILKCSDGTLYTGYAKNVDERLEIHNQGRGARYTRGRLPVELVYCEHLEDKSLAMSREFEIKQMTREQKEELIERY